MNSPLNVGEKSHSGNKDLNPPKTDSISPYAVPGVSLPTLKESDDDDAGETGHAIADSPTNSPTTLPRGKLTPVLDIFIAAMKAALEECDDDAGAAGPVVAESTMDAPTTVVRGETRGTLDISLAAMEPSHDDDEGGEPKHVIVESTTVTPTSTTTTLILGDTKETFDMNNKLTDVDVWNDDCPLPSTGHTCSEWQNTDNGNSSGFEDMSTQVLTAGCLPQCEEPRSGCVNIESVIPLEQVSHLPTSINEDGTNIVGNDGRPQFHNKVEGNLNRFNRIIGRSKLRKPSISISYLSLFR